MRDDFFWLAFSMIVAAILWPENYVIRYMAVILCAINFLIVVLDTVLWWLERRT